MSECPFCKRIAAGHYDYDGLGNVAFEPLNPVTPGHFLVVPRRHVADAFEVPRLTGYAVQFAAALAQEMGLESCNLITSVGEAATQSVRHLHWHVIPRRPGDGLALPWTGQKPLAGSQIVITCTQHGVRNCPCMTAPAGSAVWPRP